MTRSNKMWMSIFLGLFLVAAGFLFWVIRYHGFSAREEPSRIEAMLAGHARRIATPAGAKSLQNPHPVTDESIAAARHHFVEHCSTCHALDGSGNTVFGRNMYPKVPDLRDQETQKLTDGELYYVISNGVRFTGMPAFGGEDSPQSIWELVTFIRRLPKLTPDELKEMERMASGDESAEGEGKEVKPHKDAPGTKPHKH